MANGLYQAVQECRYQQVKFLVESGLSVGVKNSEGHNLLVAALHVQNKKKRLKMFRYLLKRGANWRDIDDPTGRDMLQWACCLDRTDEAMILLNDGQGDWDLSRLDIAGYTALHYATMHNNVCLVNLFCNTIAKFRLNVDVIDVEGFTPYMHAKRLGHDTCARILLEQGMASPEQFDNKHHQSVLHWSQLGATERERKARRRRRKTIAAYKTLGRLPELKAVQFDLERVQIVESKLDKALLSSSLQGQDRVDHNIFEESASEDGSHHKRRGRSLNSLDTSSELEEAGAVPNFEPARRISYHDALTLLSLTKAGHEHNSPTADNFKNSLPDPSKKENTYKVLMYDLLQVLTEQSTKAYKPCVVKPPAPARDRHHHHHHHKEKGSSLAAIMNQDRKQRAQLSLSRKLSKSPGREHRRNSKSPHRSKVRADERVAGKTPVATLPLLKERSGMTKEHSQPVV